MKVLKGDLTPGFDIALGFKDLTGLPGPRAVRGRVAAHGQPARSLFQLIAARGQGTGRTPRA